MRDVSKEVFLNALLCPTLGWLMRSGELKKKTADLTLGEKFRIEEGIEIGKRARRVFSDGHLIDDRRVVSAAENTQKLVNDLDISTIFEATFMKDGLITSG